MLAVKQIRAYIRRGREDFADIHKLMARWDEFYVNKSWDIDDKTTLEARGQKAVEVNITAPAVDLIVGMLTSAQMDYDAKPMVTAGKEVGKQGTWALKHVNTIADLDMHRRLATEDAVKKGVGYILSGPFVFDEDPSEEIMQYTRVPPDWVWYDLDDHDLLLRRAKFIGISRWIPVADLKAKYRGMAEKLDSLVGNPDSPDRNVESYYPPLETGTTVAIPRLDQWSTADWNVADRHREVDRHKKEVMVHEVYYRDREKAHFFVGPDGQPKQFDPQTELHKLLNMGPSLASIFVALAPVIRCAKMAGPHRLDDKKLKIKKYPIVPYFWKRDGKGRPFGFIAQIEHQQQEVNVRRARALYQANSNQAQISDAYWDDHSEEDFEELRGELNKPNGILKAGIELINPWNNPNAHDQMPWVSRADAEVRMAAGITENLAGDDAGKSPKSAEASRQKTLQAGMTFEARRAGFIAAHRYLGWVALQWIIQLHPTPFPVMVSNEQTGEDALHAIRVEDVPHLIDLNVGPFTPTMLEKQIETIRMLLPILPQDPKIQAAGTIFMLNAMNLPGIEILQDAMRDYQERVEQGVTQPQPMQQPAHRPRQKRRTQPHPAAAQAS